ncbi:MAG: hypothetical protein A3I89_01375 [Candidatus Harrisonbacteria bacterium RIFCSPLOWO2_02_FULL_41_11]|uniref:LTD domain-containing protein n=1 Tax=Candidatus Harrisonbacteria bacterium RIFCSPHIGHO2_02_FULL_42_16 TaxID=1798404 RepID=A0A1G1ZH67_9BACT|nr:MAG: hypothetical protein A3B92_02230 [Candidatus Harrisonbacteria bacterium RIFCSPHIGHO2_02_FULL_42_16]OGY67462.1 MAG: hypothetical protein A3I89_01375 [Candidatus Harrisonbacteria bacterium RIFCSPLOWO2_02_FULL_41_11]
MHQYIGLILLILAVSAGIYLAGNHGGLPDLKIPFSFNILPSPVHNYQNNSGVANNNFFNETVIPELESRKSARISYVSQPGSFGSYYELGLSADLSSNEKLNITGWTVKSNRGSFEIPQSQEIYSFGGSQRDIVLRPGDRVKIYSTESPKGNFRANKCLGYLGSDSFSPPLPKDCPYVSRAEINNFSGYCQDYLLSLGACENPSANPPVPHSDAACFDFLRKLNYDGCVEKYRNDDDFLSGDWLVWLGKEMNVFDSLHDKVQLLDKSGKLADEYIY